MIGQIPDHIPCRLLKSAIIVKARKKRVKGFMQRDEHGAENMHNVQKKKKIGAVS
jgi:hypothetical protein